MHEAARCCPQLTSSEKYHHLGGVDYLDHDHVDDLSSCPGIFSYSKNYNHLGGVDVVDFPLIFGIL